MNVLVLALILTLPLDSVPPDVIARVYDDDGVNGTSGFTLPLLGPREAIGRGNATLAMVGGPNYRANIGVRAQGESTRAFFSLTSATGTFLAATERTLPANSFQQFSTASLFGSAASSPGASVVVGILGGAPAFFYLSTTDNRTNDSAVQIARPQGE